MTTALDYMGTVGHGLRASTLNKAREVLTHVQGGNTITHVWGYDPNASNTEHHSGLAADFMVYGDKALGDRVYAYLWANRVRLGVRHIIWQRTITSTVVNPGVRRAMADRGNPTANHMDHVHVQFLTDSYAPPVVAQPSKPAAPKLTPTYNDVLRKGLRSNVVRSLQQGLNRAFPLYSNLTVDGEFGTKTEWVVREFQRRSGLAVDGEVGPLTRAKLAQSGVRF